jgi:hypothetical protein
MRNKIQNTSLDVVIKHYFKFYLKKSVIIFQNLD